MVINSLCKLQGHYQLREKLQFPLAYGYKCVLLSLKNNPSSKKMYATHVRCRPLRPVWKHALIMFFHSLRFFFLQFVICLYLYIIVSITMSDCFAAVSRRKNALYCIAECLAAFSVFSSVPFAVEIAAEHVGSFCNRLLCLTMSPSKSIFVVCGLFTAKGLDF